jgi:hypothetical protein
MKGGKKYSTKYMKGGYDMMMDKDMMMKGGMYDLSPSAYDGQGVGTSGAALQIMATNMS